jgi:oxaloacetate decarboxylase alpha subunit
MAQNTFVVNVDGKDYTVVIGDNVVKVDGKEYKIAVREEGTAAVAAPAAASNGAGVEVHAPVAGTILRYVCANGDVVEKDETILIMESMKMELEVRSTVAGVVTFKADSGSAVAAEQTIAVVC